jgi:hypothetical protein
MIPQLDVPSHIVDIDTSPDPDHGKRRSQQSATPCLTGLQTAFTGWTKTTEPGTGYLTERHVQDGETRPIPERQRGSRGDVTNYARKGQ